MMYTYLYINRSYEATCILCMWRMFSEIGGICIKFQWPHKSDLYIVMYTSLL